MFCHCPAPVTIDQETILALQRTMVRGEMVREGMAHTGMAQTAIAGIVPGAIEIHLRALEQTGKRPFSTVVTSSLSAGKGWRAYLGIFI